MFEPGQQIIRIAENSEDRNEAASKCNSLQVTERA